ncbi:MAG: GlgB N-terminal domain-containing protein, partial [Terracidiphilus sp.]
MEGEAGFPAKMSKVEHPTESAGIRNSFDSEVEAIAQANHGDPFRILGPHWIERGGKPSLSVRAFRHGATEAKVVWKSSGTAYPADRIHPDGAFEAVIPSQSTGAAANQTVPADAYRWRFRFADGSEAENYDPYAFPPVLSDYDLYLSGEGTDLQKYEKLGAHLREVAGVQGVHFGVWAPNASRVSVIGDFNSWDGTAHPMRSRGESGIWEIFIPELKQGTLYKFEILSRFGHHLAQKADPYGFAAEMRPKSASMVWDVHRYGWNDSEWLSARAARDWLHSPLTIYEIHAGSWRRKVDEGYRWLTYREMADELVPYAKKMG